MSGHQTWAKRPDVPSNVKSRSLRNGLLWTFGVVQAAFIVWVVAVYIRAEAVKNGDGFHDLGVYIGRQVVLNQIQQIWFVTDMMLGALFVGLYLTLKNRWNKR
jgi:hypothetical protein